MSSCRGCFLKALSALMVVACLCTGSATAQELLQKQKLFPSLGSNSSVFPLAIAIDGDTMVAGGSYKLGLGSAFVFERDPATAVWSQVAALRGTQGTDYFDYGLAVAISGDTIVIGAHDARNDQGVSLGEVYSYERDSLTGQWQETEKLVSPEPAGEDNRRFGFAVALDGSTLAISDVSIDPPQVHIYDREPGTDEWRLTTSLNAFDGRPSNGFGHALALADGRLFVGANLDREMGSGAVYLYERDEMTSTWNGVAKLFPSEPDQVGIFGQSLDLLGSTLVVGSSARNISKAGDLFVFELDPIAGTWSEVAKLDAAIDPLVDSFFGYNLALGPGGVVAGDRFDSDFDGVFYFFASDEGADGWEAPVRLVPSDLESDDAFGGKATSHQGTIAVGSFRDKTEGLEFGSIYIFEPSGLGGSVTGVESATVRCVNRSSGQRVEIEPPLGVTWWDCAAAGLAATSGDGVSILLSGVATGADISGAVADWRLDRVACLNQATGARTEAVLTGDNRTWNCTSAGLEAEVGDEIRVSTNGFAGTLQ